MKTTRTCERCKVARPLTDYAMTTFGYHRRTCEFCRGGKREEKKRASPRKPTTPVVGVKRTCRTCGKTLPSASFRKMPDRYGKGTVVRVSVCRSCDRAAQLVTRKRRSEEDRAKIALRSTKKCNRCGRVKPITKQNFYHYYDKRRKQERFHGKCKVCMKIQIREYYQTKKGRAARLGYMRSKRGRASHNAYERSAAGRARSRRYVAKVTSEMRRSQKLLRYAIEGKRIVPPRRCPSCRSRRQLRAWFNRRLEDPLDVSFMCHRCWWERKKKVDFAAKYKGLEVEVDKEEAPKDRFACGKVEWQRFCDLHVAALEREDAAVAAAEGNGDPLGQRRAFLTRCYFGATDLDAIVEAKLDAEGWFDGPAPMERVLGVWVESA